MALFVAESVAVVALFAILPELEICDKKLSAMLPVDVAFFLLSVKTTVDTPKEGSLMSVASSLESASLSTTRAMFSLIRLNNDKKINAISQAKHD
jgi:hypothetical protein